MPLPPGTRLGSYEIVVSIGAGGMGEVYRAHDTNLGRDVALKTLPDLVNQDPERLARFRREAQLLAALNHPHIAAIYGLEEAGGQRFIVLELVDGETLADRLRRGSLPFDEAIAIAREIADALQSAHERGIIHRDLKPANIALTTQDRVKILDFGLAKAIDPAAVEASQHLDSPTITSPAMLTGAGVILGTAAYMSPEQAKGRAADKRSDVWAFGCVLFEMLTARRAFEGDGVSETLASVLKSCPAWEMLPASVPAPIRMLLEGCLEKDHRQRIADISTAAFVLKRAIDIAPAAASNPRGSRRVFAMAALLGAAVAGLVAASMVAWWPRAQPVPATVARFGIGVRDDAQLTTSRRALAISPDGTRIVYSASSKLYLRSVSDLESRPIAGGDPGIGPEFSPDGNAVVFWGDGMLKRVPATGGTPFNICPMPLAPLGLHWSDGGIIYTQPGTGVLRVSPDGGPPDVIVKITGADGIAQGARLMPAGRSVMFGLAPARAAGSDLWDKASIVLQTLGSDERTTIVQDASEARYLGDGRLLYMVEGTLMGVRYDAAARKVTSAPVAVLEGVRRSAVVAGYAAQYDLSATGSLVYLPGAARSGQEDVYLQDRAGTLKPLNLPRASYSHPRVSPDGTRIVVQTSTGQESIVSLYELSGASSLRRLTFGGNNWWPIWSSDGKRVAFQSDREGDLAIFWQPVDGGTAERLTRPDKGVSHLPEAWLPKGDMLFFSETRGVESTLWSLSLRDRKLTRFDDVKSPAFPTMASFSPDGRWIAYQEGDGTTTDAVTYVQPYPANGTKYEVARGGRALWSPDGKELFFVPGPSQFASISVRTQPSISFSTPVPVLRRFGLAPPHTPRPFDILPDGRFVIVDATSSEARLGEIFVVLNWPEELNARMPPAK